MTNNTQIIQVHGGGGGGGGGGGQGGVGGQVSSFTNKDQAANYSD